jgi:hypothetical protein
MVRYNTNQKFSTAALAGGTQIQRRSAWTVLPTLQFATYNFHNEFKEYGSTKREHIQYRSEPDTPDGGYSLLSLQNFQQAWVQVPSLGVDFF